MLKTIAAIAALTLGCGGTQRTQPLRNPGDVCRLLFAGELDLAGDAAHSALVADRHDSSNDATKPLAMWLSVQPCVTSVDVSKVVILTEPGIKQILVTLAPDDDGVVRACHAELTLAAGARVGFRPVNHVSTNTDTRCSPVPN